MSFPGTKSPPRSFPKKGGGTKLSDPNSKTIKDQCLMLGETSDIGTAPPSRIYTRDYSKSGRSPGDKDSITEALGNPLKP